MNPAVIDKIKNCLAEMYAKKDVELFKSICTEDFTAWHNFDQTDMSRDAVFAAFTSMTERFRDVRMDIVRVDPLVDGFVQQHVVRGTLAADGSPSEMAACVYVYLKDDLIRRVEEYVDVSNIDRAHIERLHTH